VEKTKAEESGLASSRADVVELSLASESAGTYGGVTRTEAAKKSAAAQAAPTGAQQSPAPGAAAADSAPRQVFNQSHLDGLLASFGARSGDASYDPAFDHNGDGVIDFSDLNNVLSNFEPPATEQPAAQGAAPGAQAPVAPAEAEEPAGATPAPAPADGETFGPGDLSGLLQAFGRRAGEQGYDARFDINSDGVVDFSDLNSALSAFDPPVPEQQQLELTGLLGAFGSSAGDETFDARFDYDGDGRVAFNDLNRLLDELYGD
jgi:Ca2+-binding EF-hand superfamily protein